MKWRSKVVIIVSLFVLSCGRPTTEYHTNAKTYKVESLKDAPTCSEDMKGNFLVVKDENARYLCTQNHVWDLF